MFDKIARYWRTIRYLKPVQIWYQLYYRIRKVFGKEPVLQYSDSVPGTNTELSLADSIPSKKQYENHTFTFLNLSKSFKGTIDWNFTDYGKLWTYNLNYFDFLLQQDMNKKTGLGLIRSYLDEIQQNKIGLEPYPISLRMINWIKFNLRHKIKDSQIDASIYAQYRKLLKNIEYHLMGNHLLENGCSLLIGSVYFKDASFLQKAREILFDQLDEQILSDGGHFERTPMYHQILLYRLLDCYNFMRNQQFIEKELVEIIKNKVELMLGWLDVVTFGNGDIPRVNDATDGIAPSSAEIFTYARRLGLKSKNTDLGESGYRMIRKREFECFLDVGEIGPDYIPGHAHSDTFSFILHLRNEPVIVDTGISTYEHCARRTGERSTSSHNTVMVNEEEQSEIWHSFRVGRRAHITRLEEQNGYISAEHDGYKQMGIRHIRTFEWDDDSLLISDRIMGDNPKHAKAYLHFHPGVTIRKDGEDILFKDTKIKFSGQAAVNLQSYKYASGFNSLEEASRVEIEFENRLQTRIVL